MSFLYVSLTFLLCFVPLLVQMLVKDSGYDQKKGGDATYFENKLREYVGEDFALEQWAKLIASMLDNDSSNRPTAAEAKKIVDDIREALERIQK